MRILLLSRATLFSNPGGDTIQIARTAEQLKKLGVDVEVRLTNDEIDYQSYDLIHFFNIIRPADILYHATKSGKPYVVSTIFVDYAEFEQKNSSGIRRLVSRLLSADRMEYIKVLARMIRNKEKIGSTYYLFHGHSKSIRKVISNASMLLPNSQSEYQRLKRRYKMEQRYAVIPNGVDPSLFNVEVADKRNKEQVLCVARIEPLKNQLNLIRALKNTSFELYIIGRASVNHTRYYEECKKEAGTNVHFIDQVQQSDLLKYYRSAKVHALPSWFETTGLSSLESASCGCNIVITAKGDTKEYFGDFGYYCEPDSLTSILNAVTRASVEPTNQTLSKYITEHYTWEVAALKTFNVYKEILTNPGN